MVRLRSVADFWERRVDQFAKSPWSSAVLWTYSAVWIALERGNIGWDGVLTIIGVEIALSVRRWQGRQ